jgi:hypothetical protein
MVIKIVEQINDDETLEAAWELYLGAFRELNTMAVQRHLMYRHEFDEVMNDQRVQKHLCVDDDGTLCGLSTYTNDLTAVPLIAPEYFERHWPEHYAANKIWYIGFVALHPQAQGRRMFRQMVEQLYIIAATQGGLVGIDICSYNDEVLNFSHIFRSMVERLMPNMRFQRIDQQSYWLYDFSDEPAA